MFNYSSLKKEAVDLRRKGATYSEILKNIKVSKSTLSLWLRDVGLSKRVQYQMSAKKILSAKRGGLARKIQADKTRFEIYEKSINEIDKISKKELWLIGTALYWAEGSKEKEWYSGSGFKFSNSDVRMIKLIYKWLTSCLNVDASRINFELYVHTTVKERIPYIKRFWSESLSLPISTFKRVYFKNDKINTKRRNKGDLYNGLLRVTVCASSSLVRQCEGWVRGMEKALYN